MSFNLRVAVLGVLLVMLVAMWTMAWASKRFEHVTSGVAALDDRKFDALTVVTVGTGGTFENPWRLGPCIAVGLGTDLVLIDAGRAVTEALRRAEIPAHQPLHVLLTSLLPENTAGLDDLIATGWLGPRTHPLTVYGPPGTDTMVERLLRAHQEGLAAQRALWTLPEAGGRVAGVVLEPGSSFEIGGLRVESAALGGAPLPALGYRVEGGARSVVIAGTGSDPGAVSVLAKDANLLVTGALFGASLDAALEAELGRGPVLEAEASQHFRLETLGGIAQNAGVRGLALVRLRPPPVFAFQYERVLRDDGFRGSVWIAEDAEAIAP